jgi:hypothetical protein
MPRSVQPDSVLEGVYGPRHEHEDDHQREHTLNHRQDLASSRQYGRVGWSESCARGKGHEQVVQEIRRPADGLLPVLLSDLREQVVLARVSLPGLERAIEPAHRSQPRKQVLLIS